MSFMHFLQQLDALIQEKHLLKHPFYQAWSKGELSLDCLKEYAKDYYQHVKAFPTYLSAIHSHTIDPSTRRVLLQNLIEEEAGSPNHPELWRAFALSLGVTEEELDNHVPSKEMEELIATFQNICRNKTVLEGVAALYAYESQIPPICVSKIEGLKSFYGLTNPKSFEYFSVHIAADEEHAAQERALLEKTSPQEEKQVLKAAQATLDVLWNFLSGMCPQGILAC